MQSSRSEFIVIKLKPGWAFDAASGAVRRSGRVLQPAVPQGMKLVPALAVPLPPHGRPTPAERELARFVHLMLADESVVDEALALVRDWPFVERAERPLSPPSSGG